mgnify:CR=1 FL=1
MSIFSRLADIINSNLTALLALLRQAEKEDAEGLGADRLARRLLDLSRH